VPEPVDTQAAGPSLAELARAGAEILDAVERIETQAARGRATFADDELAQNAVIRIDVDLVWSAAQNDLPKLGAQIRAILNEIS
jgi:uncharacterized protein with HEPN domain